MGGIAAAGSLINTIEQQRNQGRLANQVANSLSNDAANAQKQQMQADADMNAQKEANQARTNQKKRISGLGGTQTPATTQSTLLSTTPTPAATSGGSTLIGQ